MESSQIQEAGGPQFGIGSGTISAHGDITSVFVAGNMDAASILSKGSIDKVQIDGSMTGGSEIHASVNIGSVSVDPVEEGIRGPGILGVVPHIELNSGGMVNCSIFADRGSIGSVTAGGYGSGNPAIGSSFIAAGKNIGTIEADAVGSGPGAFGIVDTEIAAGGTINRLDATSSDDTAICTVTVHAGGSINSIDGESFSDGEDAVGVGILNSDFHAKGDIGSIFGSSQDTQDQAGGITSSHFDALGDIGSIQSMGVLTGSSFMAGVKSVVAPYSPGFASKSSGHIGDIQVTVGGVSESTAAGITGSLFFAGKTIGNVTVFDNVDNEGGTNTGIIDSHFFAGMQGDGGIGNITVHCTQENTDDGGSTTNGIANSTFDASVAAGHSGNIGRSRSPTASITMVTRRWGSPTRCSARTGISGISPSR